MASDRVKLAKKMIKKPETPFKEIDLSKQRYVPNGMTRAFANNRYIVQIHDDKRTDRGTAICALIQKVDDTPILQHWKEIQRIKNEIFGKDTWAVEYYPAESELLDDHNIYWIWIFPNNDLPIPRL